MKQVFIIVEKHTCEKRYLDGHKIRDYFSKNNYKIVDSPKKADIIFFVTCAASEKLADRSLKKIMQLKKYDAELIVGGCLPAIEKERLSKIFNGRTIITKSLNQIDNLFQNNKINYSEIPEANMLHSNIDECTYEGRIKKSLNKTRNIKNFQFNTREDVLKNLFGEKSFIYAELTAKPYFYVTSSWGCLGNCSYCAIKKATGSLVSKPINQCVHEFKNGLKAGFKHFKIVGDDVGAYGIDIDNSLPTLLDEITKIPGDYEITIQSIHPRWIVKYIDDLEEILIRGNVIHMAVLIQSANKRILSSMNRYSDIDKIRIAFTRLRKSFPDLIINTHCIIGFPSESREEFKETLDFISEFKLVGFIFPFSDRPDIKANSLEPKISEKEIIDRLNYAKKYLKRKKYKVIYLPKTSFFMFDKIN